MTTEKPRAPKLGIWILTALVVGNMIGSGVFLLPSALARFGSIGILSWVLTAAGAIFIALVFAHLSRMIPKVGGPYAYCRAGFGDFVGFLIAYNYWIALWVGNAAILVAFIGYLSVFWPSLAGHNELEFFISVLTLWFVTAINIVGVRQAGIFQLITTILKLLPLIVLATLGLFYIHPHNFADFNVSHTPFFTALTAAASLTLWSFIGLESATVPAEAVADPKRMISRATIIGTVITAVVYIFSTVAVMGVIPSQALVHSTAPFADAARIMFGHWAGLVVGAGAIIACVGALNGWTLLTGQVPMAAARDGLFPRAFVLQSKSGSPVYGLIISSLLITVLLFLTLRDELVKQFTFIILLATFSSLIPYFFTTMAELMLLFKRRDQFRPKRLAISITIAIIAGFYVFWTIIGAGKDIVYYGVLLMLTGVPVYVWVRWRDYARTEAEKEINAAMKD